IGLELEDIRDGAALGGAPHLGNFVNFFHVRASRRGEKHQVIVRGRGKKMFHEIAFLFLGSAFARLHADHTLASAPLRTKRAHSRAFNKAPMSNADDATLVRDQIFHVDLRLIGRDFRQACRAVFVANFPKLFFDNREDTLLFGQDVAEVFDGVEEFLVLLVDLFSLEPRQLIQPKIKDFISLMFAEGVAAICQAGFTANQYADLLDLTLGEFEGQQFYSGFIAAGRSANNAEKFVEISERNEVTLERFSALFRFTQFEAGATQHNLAPVLDIAGVCFLE